MDSTPMDRTQKTYNMVTSLIGAYAFKLFSIGIRQKPYIL